MISVKLPKTLAIHYVMRYFDLGRFGSYPPTQKTTRSGRRCIRKVLMSHSLDKGLIFRWISPRVGEPLKVASPKGLVRRAGWRRGVFYGGSTGFARRASFMFKGTIYLLAISTFLFGCASQMAYQPPPTPSQPVVSPDPIVSEDSLSEKDVKSEREGIRADIDKEEKLVSKLETSRESFHLPDIAITNFFLNPKGRLVVTLANRGEGPLPLGAGQLWILLDGQLEKKYTLNRLSDQPFFPPKESLSFTTPLKIAGRHEIRARVEFSQGVEELNKRNNILKGILEGPSVGPDVVLRDLVLTEDMELSAILSNAGAVDLRKGAHLQIRIFVNGRKISEFEHFTSDTLKANSANRYVVDPPYQVGLSGVSRVKVSISPTIPSHDICLENNTLERTFSIFAFMIEPQGREEFSFLIRSSHFQNSGQTGKVSAEARWDGGGAPLVLSSRGPGNSKTGTKIWGKSPLKLEFPVPFEDFQKANAWKVSVTNLMEKKAEGNLIIQHQ